VGVYFSFIIKNILSLSEHTCEKVLFPNIRISLKIQAIAILY
jgi:hypothetical protein